VPNLLAQAPETVARPHAARPVQPSPPKPVSREGSTIRDRPRERPCFLRMERIAEFLPDWATSLIVLALAVLLALWLHSVVYSVLERAVRGEDLFRRSVVSRTRGPSRFAIVLLAIALAGAVAPLAENERVALRQTTVFCIVLVTGWALLAALHVWLVIYLRRFKLDSEDNWRQAKPGSASGR
jgi:hypothetical protein